MGLGCVFSNRVVVVIRDIDFALRSEAQVFGTIHLALQRFAVAKACFTVTGDSRNQAIGVDSVQPIPPTIDHK